MEWSIVLGLAVVLRLALLPAAPSDDIHRYLWEGKLVAQGVSPYGAPARDSRFSEYWDDQWAQMNHLDALTAYPPGAELIFALLTDVVYSPFWFKCIFAALDVGVVALVLALLSKRALPLRWAGWYAFNPVVLLAFAAEGHFDVLMIVPILAAAMALDREKRWQAAAYLGLAVQMKIIAVLALPFLLRRIGWRYLLGFAAPVLLLSLPFAGDLGSMLKGLAAFGSGTNFNGFPYLLLLELFDSRAIANGIVATMLAGLLAWRIFRPVSANWEGDWLFACAALLVLSPTVHFWYLAWILPFVALRPSLAWLVFSVSLSGYFLVWRNMQATGVWELTLWQQAMIWSPFLVVALWEWCAHRKKAKPVTTDLPDGVSVIIPALNAGELLPECVRSLRESTSPLDEIIVVDGGSDDDSVKVAEALQCKVFLSEKGRGQQIAKGIRSAKFRYVLIMHADCQIAPASIERMRAVLRANPGVVGGAIGQRFNRESPMLLFIEALNELRATMGGVSFGDQAQFFDRAALPNEDFPAQPLMEDVELSLRLRSRGRLVYLGAELVSAAAKWQRVGSWRRIALVLRFVLLYRIARWRGMEKAADLSQRLYREYYLGS